MVSQSKNHMKGSHKDVQPILDAIEGRNTEITQSDLDTNFGIMCDLDCNQLSAAVYHMLNQLLTGKAHKELSDHERAQGLEVWRAITLNLTNRGPHKRCVLLEKAQQPTESQDNAGCARDPERVVETPA